MLCLFVLLCDDCVFDLFCGIGNFMLLFVWLLCEVIGIEGSDMLIMCVLVNVCENGVDGYMMFVCWNLFEVIGDDFCVFGVFDKFLIDLLCEGVFVVLKVLVEIV